MLNAALSQETARFAYFRKEAIIMMLRCECFLSCLIDCDRIFADMPQPNLSNIERQRRIIAEIDASNRISINQICDLFQVSEATARRDLEQLAAQGKIQRVHGGAIALEPGLAKHGAPPEQPVLHRAHEQQQEKRRIGSAAAALVRDEETVFIGSGTTTLEVARNLKKRSRLTVITNSLPVINLLAGDPGINLVALGGIFRLSEQSFIGHISEQSLVEVRVDKVYLGIRAVDLDQGLTNDYLPETRTDRAIMGIGREIILVADHTKMGRVAAAFLAPMDAIHCLVTDDQTPAAFIEAIKARDKRVIIA